MDLENQIICGDALSVLKCCPEESFQCCITSPPYWGLRDYGYSNQIGSESDYKDYILHLVAIFREVKRTLKEDGVLWLNIGDSYTSGNRKWRDSDKKNQARGMNYRPPTPEGLKPKDLIGIPWRLALALQDDGWFFRSDIVWYKPNCQPESVKDRPTRAHEYLFLMSKSKNYYYDNEAIKEPSKNGNSLRNRRTVWAVNTEPKLCPHFAMFPEALIEPCIMAGSRKGDIVIDPFFGAGTVGVVAKKNERNYFGIEIKPDYVTIAQHRIEKDKI